MIEHFLKWLKLAPLLDHNNESSTYAFLDMVLNRFGALVEILIDKCRKFYEEFQKLCEKKFINHYTIS
jgi:hypothetical protein